jgi:hypothetical protein
MSVMKINEGMGWAGQPVASSQLVNFPGMTLAIRPGYGPMVEAIDENLD